MSPYIVTTKRKLRGTHRRAVATLEEARRFALRVIDDKGARQRDRRAVCDLPESGGTVGPLPDGTVIEVETTTWERLAIDAGLAYPITAAQLVAVEQSPDWVDVAGYPVDISDQDDSAQTLILDAYNARQS